VGPTLLPMGTLVVTSGRITLPEHLEGQALTVLEVELGGRAGPFDPERLTVGTTPVETLADLATLAGVTVAREGEELLFSTDHRGDPRWSEQAAAFWTGLGRFATDGEIHLRGADGATWSYRYSGEGVEQVGAPAAPTTAEPPAAPQEPPAAPSTQTTPEPTPQEPAPPPEEPRAGWPPPLDPADDPLGYPRPDDPRAFLDPDDAPPRSPGRTTAMAALLVVGVLLIVGLALLTAGLF
jgi:hypothetical protein